MTLSAFWADVLRPAFHALAPEEPRVVTSRVRSAAIGAAFFAGLLPAYGPLGTGTVQDSNILAGVYAVAAVVVHLRRNVEKADAQAVGVLFVAGVHSVRMQTSCRRPVVMSGQHVSRFAKTIPTITISGK